jgi:hypothetical protein
MTFGITRSINVPNGMKGLQRCASVGAMGPPIFGEKNFIRMKKKFLKKNYF